MYCFIRMIYDPVFNKYSNSPGIQVRVPGIGGTEGIEYLDTLRQVPYFNTLVKYFVDKGYTRNTTIRGAPYDWRMDPGKCIYIT